mmetsp:Transcript_42254/g.99184  ORF Transcript_42254/g.99184 Transcript_42254/m.99184 type:complete len:232 (-) Transcript_42254:1155-1850(-)
MLSGFRPRNGCFRSSSVSLGPILLRIHAMTAGAGRISSMARPTVTLTKMRDMKVTACVGKLLARMSWILATGLSTNASSSAKMEPDMAETKKVWMTIKSASLPNREPASDLALMCPSSPQYAPRMIGSRAFNTISPSGERAASTSSSAAKLSAATLIGQSPAASHPDGPSFLSSSTFWNVATKATGRVQSTQVIPVRNPAMIVLRVHAQWFMAALLHTTSSGAGASSANTA